MKTVATLAELPPTESLRPGLTQFAVDPGKNGGIAVRYQGDRVLAFRMPATEGDLRDLFVRLYNPDNPTVAYVEKVGGYIGGPGAPGSAMFNFGRNFGFILGAFASLYIRTELITPQQWQKRLSLGTSKGMNPTEWKNKLKAEAQRRFPDMTVTLYTADALLILEATR
jgi:hypothetical protein